MDTSNVSSAPAPAAASSVEVGNAKVLFSASSSMYISLNLPIMLPPLSPGANPAVSMPAKCNSAASWRSTDGAPAPPALHSARNRGTLMDVEDPLPHSFWMVFIAFSDVAASTITFVTSSWSNPATNAKLLTFDRKSDVVKSSPSSLNHTPTSMLLPVARLYRLTISSGMVSSSTLFTLLPFGVLPPPPRGALTTFRFILL